MGGTEGEEDYRRQERDGEERKGEEGRREEDVQGEEWETTYALQPNFFGNIFSVGRKQFR
jgi:hypothetical protein